MSEDLRDGHDRDGASENRPHRAPRRHVASDLPPESQNRTLGMEGVPRRGGAEPDGTPSRGEE